MKHKNMKAIILATAVMCSIAMTACGGVSSGEDSSNTNTETSVEDEAAKQAEEEAKKAEEEAAKKAEEERIAAENQAKVDAVVSTINAIGEVNNTSNDLITAAETAFAELPDELKPSVTNADVISQSRHKYNMLFVKAAKKAIKNIGKVEFSYKKIQAAKDAYKKVPEDYKIKVTNYKTIAKKHKQYKQNMKNRKKLFAAKKDMNDGYLNKAYKKLKKLPKNFKYKKLKVSSLVSLLERNSGWMNLCGEWTSTSGQMRSTSIWDYDGSSEWWYRNLKKGDAKLKVLVHMKKDGSKKIELDGWIPIYTSYSSISEYVDEDDEYIDKKKKVTGMGTIRINSRTTVSFSSSGLSCNYRYYSPNENQYFTYVYTTKANFGKRVHKY